MASMLGEMHLGLMKAPGRNGLVGPGFVDHGPRSPAGVPGRRTLDSIYLPTAFQFLVICVLQPFEWLQRASALDVTASAAIDMHDVRVYLPIRSQPGP